MNLPVKKNSQPSGAGNANEQQFPELYFALRSLEKRIYSDEEVLRFPEVKSDHIYENEWELRKSSSQRLLSRLRKKKKPLSILEIGCGNGWLSARMAQLNGTSVQGWDIHLPELEQARRVFAFLPNLRFESRDFMSEGFVKEKFDIIVFAASLQYFSSLPKVIYKALGGLKEGGEVHILDTHFYSSGEEEKARERSENYFRSMGLEQMKAYYHQHALEMLDGFNYSILYNPQTLVNRIFKRGPFYWIQIKQPE